MSKFYVNLDGNYIGAFEGAEPPADSIEVLTPPVNAAQVWDGSAWGEVPAVNYSSVTKLKAIRYLRSIGLWTAIRASIKADQDMDDEWQASTALLITDPTLQAMKASLGWTDDELQNHVNAANEL